MQTTDQASMLRMLAQTSPAGLGWATNAQPAPDGSRWVSSYYVPPHLSLLNEAIQRLAARELLADGILGLIVTMPPRHGKSEITSHYTPAWYLGAFPDQRVALASYGDDFAAEWGRKARDLMEAVGPQFYGVEVDKRSSAADRWTLRGGPGVRAGGGMYTMGVGGQMTGRGADLLIVDDPFKNWRDASSKINREAVWNWWGSTARTRLEPGGVVLIVMTRWHEDDLVGRLLKAQEDEPGADRWMVLNLPALAEGNDPLGREPGQALWPHRYNVDWFNQTRISVGPYIWSALYQQRPSPAQGSKFQRDWFGWYVELETGVKRVVRWWDLASGEGDRNDYTVGLKLVLGADGRSYVEDIKRGRFTDEGNERLIAETAAADGPGVKVRMEQEPGASGKGLADHYRRNVLRGYDFRGVPSSGDKALRAVPVAAAAERGEVFVKRADWAEDFLDEVSLFDMGPHDDQVDALSGAYSEAHKKGGATFS